MIIAGSTLAFAASHRFAASHQRNERMQTCADHCPQPVQAEQATDLFSVSTPPLHGDAYQSGHLAAQARQAKSHQHLTSESRGGTVSDGQDDQVIKLLEQHFGIAGITKFSLDVDYLQSAGVEEAASQSVSAQQGGGQAGSGQSGGSQAGIGYDYHESYHAYEAARLGISGTISTADGKSFSLTFDYQLQRDYTRTTDVSIRTGDAAMMDPQKFANTGPSGLAAMSSFFDFKANSPMDQLVHPIPESDFPGADLGSNSHGDDGRELPGTKAGNGFIAAADAVFAKLRQWDGSNTQPLLLAMFQVATIGLQGINEPFRTKSADYRWFGEQRKLGPYLADAGQSDAVNQVNLVA